MIVENFVDKMEKMLSETYDWNDSDIFFNRSVIENCTVINREHESSLIVDRNLYNSKIVDDLENSSMIGIADTLLPNDSCSNSSIHCEKSFHSIGKGDFNGWNGLRQSGDKGYREIFMNSKNDEFNYIKEINSSKNLFNLVCEKSGNKLCKNKYCYGKFHWEHECDKSNSVVSRSNVNCSEDFDPIEGCSGVVEVENILNTNKIACDGVDGQDESSGVKNSFYEDSGLSDRGKSESGNSNCISGLNNSVVNNLLSKSSMIHTSYKFESKV